jgi:peptidoglycan/xylan/chitin deacetylase (PgdA/CDA1 family)
VSAGHQIGNHTLNHLDIASLENEKEHLREIENAHNLIKTLLGVEPVGYRAPAYFISSKGLFKLAQLGYLYDSSASNSKLTKTLLSILSFFNSSLRFKKHSTLHNRFPGNGRVCHIKREYIWRYAG